MELLGSHTLYDWHPAKQNRPVIIYDKKIAYYFLFLVIYFILTAIYLFYISSNANEWFGTWTYDLFFVFQLSTVFLIGCALIDKCFTPYTYVRFKTKAHVLFYRQSNEYIFAIFLLNIMYTVVILGTQFVLGGFYSGEIGDLMNWYVRYLLGLILLSNLSLLFKVSKRKQVRMFSQALALLILILDLLIVTPSIKRIAPTDFETIFSWVFGKDTAKCILTLIVFNVLLWLLQYRVGLKRDLSL
jgi:hypothetical protein